MKNVECLDSTNLRTEKERHLRTLAVRNLLKRANVKIIVIVFIDSLLHNYALE